MNIIVEDIGRVISYMQGGIWTGEFNQIFIAEQSPYYMFGHINEITRQLKLKDRNASLSTKKYPMFALIQDFEEPVINGYINVKLTILICAYTKITLTSAQRYEQNFRNVLYPLYDRFLKALTETGLFEWDAGQDQNYPKHTKIDRPYWGSPSKLKNVKRTMDDPLDVIEIKDLELSQRFKC